MKAIVLITFLVFSLRLFAQEVQWASEVINYSSQRGDDMHSAAQVLGAPNSMLSGGISGTAWLSGDDSRKEFLHVGFQKPMKICQVVVAENSSPGAVTRIVLYDKAENEKEVYRKIADTLNLPSRMLSARFPMTDFEVSSVKITIDCRIVPGDNQVDAIGISAGSEEVFVKNSFKTAESSFFSKAEKLDENINSEYTEVNPKISPDGKTLFINRKDYPGNENDDEIWISEWQSQQWSRLKNIGSPLNNSHHNAVESVTPDGNTLLLINQYNRATGGTGSGFSLSKRSEQGWGFPMNASVKNFANADRYTGFSLGNDRQTVVTQLHREDTRGESDLYVMFLGADGVWSEPLRMGDSINTLGRECTPFLASDNKTLSFSSNGLGGYGSNDIYMSRRKDDSWTEWTSPLNMGQAINSDEWDAYYSVPASGDYAYFVKGGDIYRIRLRPELKPLPVTLVSGAVFNLKTKEKILDAEVQYEDLGSGKTAGVASTNLTTGEYKIVLPFGKQYGVIARAKNFFSVSEELDLSEIKAYSEIRKDLYLAPVEVGQVVRLNNIFFDFGKAILRHESFPELDRTVSFLRQYPSIHIEISGHTDQVGSAEDNQKLSAARAKAVMEYLNDKGVSASSMTSNGYGESKPIGENTTEAGRQMNRRVQFEILSK